ncbi:hypothetical protein STRIP9103_09057 [Streptomyces ipomoeae 91-03]|uniref:Uncharacterized protein n=1 Tax=Streptomyces ipomoeae 91-03 TaxID=698759 RepID=L1L3I9_9ACTN|nr:hypothetical protein STRIP9103_09057 [Streptomyces ipomoeae 91-03]
MPRWALFPAVRRSVRHPPGALAPAVRAPTVGTAGRRMPRSTQETDHEPMSTLPRVRRREGVTHCDSRCPGPYGAGSPVSAAASHDVLLPMRSLRNSRVARTHRDPDPHEGGVFPAPRWTVRTPATI